MTKMVKSGKVDISLLTADELAKYRQVQAESRRATMQKVLNGVIFGIMRYLLMISLCFMIIYPLLRMFVAAISHPHTINTVGAMWIPQMSSWDNLIVAWNVMNFLPSLGFTFAAVGFVMLLQVINAAFAGYAFARLRFKGISVFFGLVLLTVVVPTQVFMLPQFIMFRNFDIFGIFTLITGEPLNMLGEPTSMFVMAGLGQGLAGGIFIYIFRQFFRGLPKELEEAAYVDGAGVPRTFFGIVLPMAKPAFLTVATLSFIWNYNDSFFTSLFHPTGMYLRSRISALAAPSGGTSTMQMAINIARPNFPLGTQTLTTQQYDGIIFTVCIMLSILPLIALFLVIQRQFVEGMERSGIVG
ncbi:MAG: carbohydrate ABC transporter permease [Firmicutes bacterium]|nr:carbohydrate ABC transporter permease [Bacillota bacterium]